MAGFTIPDGNPGLLRDLARSVLTSATTLAHVRRAALTGAGGTVISGTPDQPGRRLRRRAGRSRQDH